MRLARAATTVAAVTAALTVPLATPAAADGPTGCAGFPSIPETYVCIVQNTPENAVPTVTTTTMPVTIPAFCYVAGCTEDTTVDVPVPDVEPGTGVLIVLSYQGTQYPIAMVDPVELARDAYFCVKTGHCDLPV